MKKFLCLFLAICCLISFTACDLLTNIIDIPDVNSQLPEVPSKTHNKIYNMGEVLDVDGLKISCEKCDKYEGRVLEPDEGYVIIRVYISVENNSSSEIYIGGSFFHCYVNDSIVKSYYGGEERFNSGYLSPGRNTSGYVYFEVPQNKHNIELEYEINSRTNKKAIFKIDY